MNNISKLRDYKDFVIYRANCSCMDPDHDQSLLMEFTPDFGEDGIALHLEHNISKAPLKTRLKFLFTGTLDGYNTATFIFHGSEAIVSYMNALRDGLHRLFEAKAEHEAKSFKP